MVSCVKTTIAASTHTDYLNWFLKSVAERLGLDTCNTVIMAIPVITVKRRPGAAGTLVITADHQKRAHYTAALKRVKRVRTNPPLPRSCSRQRQPFPIQVLTIPPAPGSSGGLARRPFTGWPSISDSPMDNPLTAPMHIGPVPLCPTPPLTQNPGEESEQVVP